MRPERLVKFAPMPKRSYDLMMAAARSVKEEKRMKRKTSAALAFAVVLVLAAGAALAIGLSLKEVGQQVLKTEQAEGTYQDWPTQEKISLVGALAGLGYIEEKPEVAQLISGELNDGEARRAADEALTAFTQRELKDISFTEIMEAVWGPFPSWSVDEKAWFSQLMADTGLQGADHTFYKMPEGPVDEQQAIAIARREIAAGYGIDESVLDKYERFTSFQVPEFLTAGDGDQPYWHIEYVMPLKSREDLPFTGISVFVHPETGTLLQSVQSILSQRQAFQTYKEDPLFKVQRDFSLEHGSLASMSHEVRARYSKEIVPVMLQLAEKYPEYYPALVLAQTAFTYGVPDEKAISEKDAEAIVAKQLKDTFGYKPEEVKLFTDKMNVYYDITAPDRPLWKFFIFRPGKYDIDTSYVDAVVACYGKDERNYPVSNYKIELDAMTGEVVRAIPVKPVLDIFSLEEQMLIY